MVAFEETTSIVQKANTVLSNRQTHICPSERTGLPEGSMVEQLSLGIDSL